MAVSTQTDVHPIGSAEEHARLSSQVREVLEEARRRGASAAEAGVATGSGFSVTVRLGEVETVEHDRDRGLGVTVYFGQRKGSASTADLSPRALRETVEAACSIARYTSEDPCHGLADPDLLAREVPDLGLYHPWDLSVEAAIDLARAGEDAARAADARVANSEGATVSCHVGDRVYGNSHGFLGAWSSSRHGLNCSVIARDEIGMQRGYWYTAARDPTRLEAPEAVGRRAAERAVARLGARRIPTTTARVLFAPEVATSLFGHFLGAIRGSALYRKASFLVDHRGRPVFPGWLGLREEPHIPGAIGSAPFDQEGVATHPRDLVAGGVLQGYVLDTYSACRLGLRSTGNAGGVHNLVVPRGEDDLPGLLRRMGEGLLVTELMGMGVNLVTGDYSRGAAGFWVEGGEVRFPVHEVTVAGNLRAMFQGLQATGADVDERGAIRTGSVLLDRLTIAGI
ncbi:MAG: metalloprotease PmbA [Gammaproteobacteria bacterium]|nr:metalloprotease PmbA [Gammaproteobacteria bacterium]